MINNVEISKNGEENIKPSYSKKEIDEMLSLYSPDSEGGKRSNNPNLNLSKLRNTFKGMGKYFSSPENFKSPFEEELKQET